MNYIIVRIHRIFVCFFFLPMLLPNVLQDTCPWNILLSATAKPHNFKSMLLIKAPNFHILFNPLLFLFYFEVFTYIKLLKFEASVFFFSLVNLWFYFTVIKYSGSYLDICITLVDVCKTSATMCDFKRKTNLIWMVCSNRSCSFQR